MKFSLLFIAVIATCCRAETSSSSSSSSSSTTRAGAGADSQDFGGAHTAGVDCQSIDGREKCSVTIDGQTYDDLTRIEANEKLTAAGSSTGNSTTSDATFMAGSMVIAVGSIACLL